MSRVSDFIQFIFLLGQHLHVVLHSALLSCLDYYFYSLIFSCVDVHGK